MANRVKHHICQTIVNHFCKASTDNTQVNAIVSKISIGRLLGHGTEFHLPFGSVLEHMSDVNLKIISEKTAQIPPDEVIKNVSTLNQKGNETLVFLVHKDVFIKSTLESGIGRDPCAANGKSVVFDFSSPNIAKPFHMGHLRSTVIGNFLANLHEWFGYRVVRLNYLGDWGTQFGLVKIGMKMLNPSSDELSQKPLVTLLQAYILANKAAEADSSILENARNYFCELEKGGADDMHDWNSYRECTISELKNTYNRLGITFTSYDWESNYRASNLISLIKNLHSKQLVTIDEEGRMVGHLSNGACVPLLKSDGTTLYLMRDIAAAIDRYSKFQFSKMIYVVDSSQAAHFKKLFDLLHGLDMPWAERLMHISFGRVRGMSTRKGEAVFLSDILDHAKQTMLDRQMLSPNTRVFGDSSISTSDVLGTSAVIVADLKHSRKKDYTFNWDDAVNPKGDTGVRLQYTHSRLCSLKDKCDFPPAAICDPNALSEPIANELVFEISRFDDVLKRSHETLEASVLVSYLFHLCTVINRALLQLRVRDSQELGPQRLMLFEEARSILHQGMVLLGLTPLSKM